MRASGVRRKLLDLDLTDKDRSLIMLVGRVLVPRGAPRGCTISTIRVTQGNNEASFEVKTDLARQYYDKIGFEDTRDIGQKQREQ